MDVRAARGTGGVMGAVRDATKVVGAIQGTKEVGKADDEGATKGLAV
jgi:hypothetical protein